MDLGGHRTAQGSALGGSTEPPPPFLQGNLPCPGAGGGRGRGDGGREETQRGQAPRPLLPGILGSQGISKPLWRRDRAFNRGIFPCLGPFSGPSAPLPGAEPPLSQLCGQTQAALDPQLPLRSANHPFPLNRTPAALPARDPSPHPLTLGRRGPAAGGASRVPAQGERGFAGCPDPLARLRPPGLRGSPELPAPTPYNVITRDIKLSRRSLIIRRVIGTEHAAACSDSPDPFAGSGCVWVWGVGVCGTILEKHCRPRAG